MVVVGVGDPELREQRTDVLLHDAGGDLEPLADPLVRPASAISSSTSRSRGASAASGPSWRSPASSCETICGSSADRRPRRGGVWPRSPRGRHAVLEEVAEALRVLDEDPHRDPDLDVLGEDHDRRVRVAGADSRAASTLPRCRSGACGRRRSRSRAGAPPPPRAALRASPPRRPPRNRRGAAARRCPRARAGCRRRSRPGSLQASPGAPRAVNRTLGAC